MRSALRSRLPGGEAAWRPVPSGPVTPGAWIILSLVVLFALAELSRRVMDNPREDLPAGMWLSFLHVYTRLVHRVRAEGMEELRRQKHPGPLIVVCNHTAGVDPLLVQASVEFEPRWVMAEDMRWRLGEGLWRYGEIIFVDRQKGDLSGTREAIRHVKAGRVLGLFPEGRIERPARMILPFEPGVGFLIRRSGAPVLPVIIDGTPETPSAWGSLYTRSRSRVRFMELIDYSAAGLSAEEITRDLEHRYREWTGWPMNESAG
jgi:1-acyl-sn-glycerol-3-phosphate acyltransferase